MKRRIEYTALEKSITPSTRQWGGMQFEDNATEVCFNIAELKQENMLWRIDFDSPNAGYSPSENLDNVGGVVSRAIPYNMTRHGGEVQVTLVGTEVDVDGKHSRIVYSIPTTIYFTEVQRHTEQEAVITESISAMEKSVKEMHGDFSDKYDRMEDIYVEADIIDRHIEEIKDCSAVYVGSGEMPDWANVQIDPDGKILDADDLKGAGRKTDDGGEIFGDYDSNKAYGKTAAAFGSGSVAGSKGFNIQSYDADARTVTLDSLVGLEVGFVCSMGAREKHFDLFGKITGINGNVVTFDSFPNFAEFPDFDYEKDIPTMLWIPDHPELGTTIIDSAAFASGSNNRATGENSVAFGTENQSIGKHSSTFGTRNIAAFAANAIGFFNKAFGRSSQATGVLNETSPEAEGAYAGGNNSKAKHPFSFVHGFFLRTAAKFQAIFGIYNKPNENALFQVGNGDVEGNIWEPRTAFEVLKDGSAKVQTQGTSDDSVVQLAELIKRIKTVDVVDIVNSINYATLSGPENHAAQLKALFETVGGHTSTIKNHGTQLSRLWDGDTFIVERLQSQVNNKQSKITCGTIDPITGGVVGVDGDVYIQIVE